MRVSDKKRMIRSELDERSPYRMMYWQEFDMSVLELIRCYKRAGRKNNKTVNDVIIAADTETSKKPYLSKFRIEQWDGTFVEKEVQDNHVCAWTISIRAFDRNIVTLYGAKPSEFCACLDQIHKTMKGEQTLVYFHNYAYDYVFLRQFMFIFWGKPTKQLNTKPHYCINMEFKNGLIIRDSLILAQRSLGKWAEDLDVDHKKAVGKWDYNKIRNQADIFTLSDDELLYIENDTLALCECLEATMKELHKKVYSLPYTATGIPREAVRKIAKNNRGRDRFLRSALTYEQYVVMTQVYHGGYTHSNRHLVDTTILGLIKAYDFASSYPFVMLSEMYPCEAFIPYKDVSMDYICSKADNYAFTFKLIMIRPRLKNDSIGNPSLQFSKAINSINAVTDNGRVLCADYIEIYLNEMDLKVIYEQYDCDSHICTDVEIAKKDYLPRWFTDYIYDCFVQKTKLKGGDPVAYSLAKSKVNSLYGMTAQKSIRSNIIEDYETGEYEVEEADPREEYEKYLNNHNSILNYQWGVWVTSYAFYNLFQMAKCAGTFIYSDTDSVYGMDWDEEGIEAYNNLCKEKLLKNGYGPVEHNGREYWLGICEVDGIYSEFRVMGAKRYCCRDAKTGKLKITVAGVPKKEGVKCLNDDINNFTKGLVFPGTVTGKLLHTYNFVKEIYWDEAMNECGDSINLSPCDYVLDGIMQYDWESIFNEEIGVEVYG